MNKLQQYLSQNIKKYRKQKKLSQEKLADLAGISVNYIGLIECGKNFPSLAMLEKIAMALDIESIDLFNKNTLPFSATEKLKKDLQNEIKKTIDEVFEKNTVTSSTTKKKV